LMTTGLQSRLDEKRGSRQFGRAARARLQFIAIETLLAVDIALLGHRELQRTQAVNLARFRQ